MATPPATAAPVVVVETEASIKALLASEEVLLWARAVLGDGWFKSEEVEMEVETAVVEAALDEIEFVATVVLLLERDRVRSRAGRWV